MAVKSITISSEAYQQLKALRRKNETFTDAISRLLARKPLLTEFAGILSKESVAYLEASVREGRTLSRARDERLRKEMA